MAENTRNERKTRIGTVVSDKMEKTIVVAVERRTAHSIYGKQMLRTAAKSGGTLRRADLIDRYPEVGEWLRTAFAP